MSGERNAMTASSSDRNKKTRQARKDKGLIEYRFWLHASDAWRFAEVMQMTGKNRDDALAYALDAGFLKAMESR